MANTGNIFDDDIEDLQPAEDAPLYPYAKDKDGLTDRERLFVIHVAQGRMSRAKAYREAGYTQDIHSSAQGAYQLLNKPHIQRALSEERVKFLKSIEMGKEEYVGFLVEAMRTPISEIDEDHPLATEKTVTTVNGGDGPEILKTTLKIYSKQHAAAQLAKVMGWEKPQEIKVGLDEKVAGLISLIRNRNKTP